MMSCIAFMVQPFRAGSVPDTLFVLAVKITWFVDNEPLRANFMLLVMEVYGLKHSVKAAGKWSCILAFPQCRLNHTTHQWQLTTITSQYTFKEFMT